MDAYYNRYQQFLINGEQTVVPFIPLQSKSSDQRYIYRTGFSRLDKVSQQYYGTPFFGWLILQANGKYGGSEINIPNNAILTIPFPLINSLLDYKGALEQQFFYYGR
jgi:hypothetical protein